MLRRVRPQAQGVFRARHGGFKAKVSTEHHTADAKQYLRVARHTYSQCPTLEVQYESNWGLKSMTAGASGGAPDGLTYLPPFSF
jgi:hypothetical protein